MVPRENQANAYLTKSYLFGLLAAFKPYTRERFNILFKESNVILDITGLFSKPGLLRLENLFESRDGLLCANVLLWEDKFSGRRGRRVSLNLSR